MVENLIVEGTIELKILPGDELSHRSDYNSNFKKYFKEEKVNAGDLLSNSGFLSKIYKIFFRINSVSWVRKIWN